MIYFETKQCNCRVSHSQREFRNYF